MLAAAVEEQRRNGGAALCGLWFMGQKHFPPNASEWITEPDLPVFIKLRDWLGRYFLKEKKLPALPLAPGGTAFQQSVWMLLKEIPYGVTTSYGDIAKKIIMNSVNSSIPPARPYMARAVANAIGHNPISIIIPCHRVIGADGALRGYAGGIERKRALLELENSSIQPEK